jgi:hypothetical protein
LHSFLEVHSVVVVVGAAAAHHAPSHRNFGDFAEPKLFYLSQTGMF